MSPTPVDGASAEATPVEGLEGGTVLGYPRIGAHRELKFALESYWAGKSSADDLQRAAARIRITNWQRENELGLTAHTSAIPSDSSYYDHVLDAAVLVDAIPPRFDDFRESDGSIGLRAYSVIARGEGTVAPLEMTKWFDTNYHYLVPEIGPDTQFSFANRAIIEHFAEALAKGLVTRPTVVGPVTLLALSKPAQGAPAGFDPLDRLAELVPVYEQLLAALAEAGARWVQIDESALVSDLLPVPRERLATAAKHVYDRLGALEARPHLLIQASYGDLGAGLDTLASTPVEGIAIDLVKGALPDHQVAGLAQKVLVAGVVNGHNVWRTDLRAAYATLQAAQGIAGRVVVGTSTSLFHVPHTLQGEDELPTELRGWLAFADEKIGEVVALSAALADGIEAAHDAFAASDAAIASRATHAGAHRKDVSERLAALHDADFNRPAFDARLAAQAAVNTLPELPTTTIGSFPQTPDIRKARAAHKHGRITDAEYTEKMRASIREVIDLQEDIGLDVLVHGEPERNDMVQYFAEHLDGFDVTLNGWVQSYGSRCTRPSILWGDVVRTAPITVEWAEYAQSLTDKPVKGMLTGPVTILAWSFVRDDQPLATTADQVALALRDEIGDLEANGIHIIQVDEPALRELLPLDRAQHDEYIDWSVGAFRLATSGVADTTQIHTHLCYSEFGQIIDAIDGLDADVTSIEAERSKMEVVDDIKKAGFSRGIGPGVYDIHSPRVPSETEVEQLLGVALASIAPERLWVNPDCGLKTRKYDEVVPALRHIVAAAKVERERLLATK